MTRAYGKRGERSEMKYLGYSIQLGHSWAEVWSPARRFVHAGPESVSTLRKIVREDRRAQRVSS